MICKSHLMSRSRELPGLLQTSENIMAPPPQILALRKPPNATISRNLPSVTNSKNSNATFLNYPPFAKIIWQSLPPPSSNQLRFAWDPSVPTLARCIIPHLGRGDPRSARFFIRKKRPPRLAIELLPVK